MYFWMSKYGNYVIRTQCKIGFLPLVKLLLRSVLHVNAIRGKNIHCAATVCTLMSPSIPFCEFIACNFVAFVPRQSRVCVCVLCAFNFWTFLNLIIAIPRYNTWTHTISCVYAHSVDTERAHREPGPIKWRWALLLANDCVFKKALAHFPMEPNAESLPLVRVVELFGLLWL